jgi:hypothetical protein
VSVQMAKAFDAFIEACSFACCKIKMKSTRVLLATETQEA